MADLALIAAALWDQQTALQDAAIARRSRGEPSDGDLHDMDGDRCAEQALALQAAIIAGQPKTMADAVAQLLTCHGEIYSQAVNWDDRSERRMLAVLDHAMRAMAVLAREAGVDLSHFADLTPIQRQIARGEVPA